MLSDAISELRDHRTTAEARRLLAELSPLLGDQDGATNRLSETDDSVRPPHEWLAGVREIARRFAASKSSGDHTVYLILLRHRERNDELGVYVGCTGLTAEERFADQMTGHKASRHVKKHGVRLLRPLFDHLEGISRDDALRIERKLAGALERAGYWVEGGH